MDVQQEVVGLLREFLAKLEEPPVLTVRAGGGGGAGQAGGGSTNMIEAHERGWRGEAAAAEAMGLATPGLGAGWRDIAADMGAFQRSHAMSLPAGVTVALDPEIKATLEAILALLGMGEDEKGLLADLKAKALKGDAQGVWSLAMIYADMIGEAAGEQVRRLAPYDGDILVGTHPQDEAGEGRKASANLLATLARWVKEKGRGDVMYVSLPEGQALNILDARRMRALGFVRRSDFEEVVNENRALREQVRLLQEDADKMRAELAGNG